MTRPKAPEVKRDKANDGRFKRHLLLLRVHILISMVLLVAATGAAWAVYRESTGVGSNIAGATMALLFVLLCGAFSGLAAGQGRKRLTNRRREDIHLLHIQAALNGATDAMAITDTKGLVVYANEAFHKLFKYSPEQLHAIFGDRQLFVDAYRHALKRVAWEGELELNSGNGRTFPALFRCSPIIDAKAELAGVLILVTDISERKQAEQELRELQSQMVQREKLASIGQLAAGVAHEMNTPVGFVASNFKTLESYIEKITKLLHAYDVLLERIQISGSADLLDAVGEVRRTSETLKMDFVLNDLDNLFEESAEGLERVTSIVQNLRDFSRVDQPNTYGEYCINEGIRATLVVARNELKHVADVKTELGELCPVRCQSGQINQVFLNILVNAAQALKLQQREGKGTVTVRTYSDGRSVVCEISDDGPGMDDDTITKIFDPFFTTKPVGIGTGLGLFVSYDIIVNKHGGELLVKSQPGEGTTFTVKLPVSKDPPDSNTDEYSQDNTLEQSDGNEVECPTTNCPVRG